MTHCLSGRNCVYIITKSTFKFQIGIRTCDAYFLIQDNSKKNSTKQLRFQIELLSIKQEIE